MTREFDDLVAEAAAPIEGWDFSWLDGRATEERPPWATPPASASVPWPPGACSTCSRAAARWSPGCPGSPGSSSPPRGGCRPEEARRAATAAGLAVVDLRTARLRTEFFDVGALVYYLRLVVWIVPGFTVERHRDRLRALHEQIETDGPLVAHATRFLIEARKPA